MDPAEIAARYDRIALEWQRETPADYGLPQLHRALKFARPNGPALDVGCGSQGRFIEALAGAGFDPEGMDVSPEMISLARLRHPSVPFHIGDICTWELPRSYAFISAWDSTFHLPLDRQEPVLEKLCTGLAPGGVLIFTCGGGAAGEIRGSFHNLDFHYSTLGVEAFVAIIARCGCFCRHVEYDQFPEGHVCIIASKPEG